MRMRKKPNLIPRLERCAPVTVSEPEGYRGRWLQSYTGYSGVDIEIGCGKGRFTSGIAAENPDILFVAVEKVPEAIVVAMERALDNGLDNVRFIHFDADDLSAVFAPGEVRRIYLNFSDPWPKNKDEKRRLTNRRFLEMYSEILETRGEIHFKTDNSALFEYSLESFELNGYELKYVTRNLHENGVAEIMTDYETRFHTEGIPIGKIIARKK